MTPAQQKRSIQRELAQHLRKKDREKLALLRVEIKNARRHRGELVRAARAGCRKARADLRLAQALARYEFREQQRRDRLTERGACSSSRAEARATGDAEIGATRKELRAERSLQREVRHAGKGPSIRSTARERRQESDDEVRQNLPSELLPVFNAVRGKIKGSPRKSRTEAFLQWAEENPGEIVAVQQAEADEYLAELLKKEAEHARAMRPARYRKTAAALRAHIDEGVPF